MAKARAPIRATSPADEDDIVIREIPVQSLRNKRTLLQLSQIRQQQ
jgi:hypothetical protein